MGQGHWSKLWAKKTINPHGLFFFVFLFFQAPTFLGLVLTQRVQVPSKQVLRPLFSPPEAILKRYQGTLWVKRPPGEPPHWGGFKGTLFWGWFQTDPARKTAHFGGDAAAGHALPVAGASVARTQTEPADRRLSADRRSGQKRCEAMDKIAVGQEYVPKMESW